MPRDVREVRGIPRWLLRDYVLEAGGRPADDATVEGDGWRVRFIQLEDFAVGSLRVGQVRVEMEGTDEGLAAIRAILEPKLLRAGG